MMNDQRGNDDGGVCRCDVVHPGEQQRRAEDAAIGAMLIRFWFSLRLAVGLLVAGLVLLELLLPA